VPQLSAVRPRMGKLQTATPLFVVRGRPPAQRVSRKEYAASTPACCNCRLVEGEKPHPDNYRGCRNAKELQKNKSQRTPKTTSGRVFSSNRTTPGVSFVAALRGSTPQHQPQALQVPEAGRHVTEKQSVPAPAKPQRSGQSVRAHNVNSQPLDR
jgi:hypothetical protein